MDIDFKKGKILKLVFRWVICYLYFFVLSIRLGVGGGGVLIRSLG